MPVAQLDEALHIYLDALDGKIRDENIVKQHVHISNDNGEVDRISFTDCPFNQGMFAVKRFAGDSFFQVIARIFALCDILHVYETEISKRGFEFPYRFVEAAATLPLSVLERWDISLFPWPTQAEIDAVEAEA